MRRAATAWLAWCAVLFGLFESCAGHTAAQRTGDLLGSGKFTPSVGLAVDALRASGTDDGDINRYLAYANAVLGRPYQGYYVRPLDGWKVEAAQLVTGKDVNDPAETPPVVPAAPLVPYRDFLVEYPPGFFVFAVPPALLSADMDAYRLLFSAFMALLLTAALALSLRTEQQLLAPATASTPDPAASSTLLRWAAGMALALGVISVRRYDPSVSLSLAGLLYGCVTRRPLVAGAAIGLGVVAKGLPILVAPLPVLYWLSLRRPRELLLASVAGLAVGLVVGLPFARAAGSQLLDVVAYHGQRPLQVESTAGSLLIALRLFDPSSAHLSETYGSANVVGRWDALPRLAAGLLPWAALAGVLLWTFVTLRAGSAISDEARRARRAGRVLLIAVCAVFVGQMTLGKVFSPQYLTWLLPIGVLAAALDGKRSLVMLCVAFALTHLIYPFAYRVGLANALHPAFGLVVLGRNALMIAWGARLLGGVARDDQLHAQARPAARGATAA